MTGPTLEEPQRERLYYEFPIDPLEFIVQLVKDTEHEMACDLGGCPYLQRWNGVEGYEDATCSSGCREEPECVTCEPEGGWPSTRPGFDYTDALARNVAETLLANARVHVDLGVGRVVAALGEVSDPEEDAT